MFRLVSICFSLFSLTEYYWISRNQPAFSPAEPALYLSAIDRFSKTVTGRGHVIDGPQTKLINVMMTYSSSSPTYAGVVVIRQRWHWPMTNRGCGSV
jgi:hypothetical protein